MNEGEQDELILFFSDILSFKPGNATFAARIVKAFIFLKK